MSKWRNDLEKRSFFHLEEAYHYGIEAYQEIEDTLERTIIFSHDAGVLAQVIYNALHSDHVEIGTFYGGTAILAALIKKRFSMHGKIYCVDPLECRPSMLEDRVTGEYATMAAVMENARKFGVDDRIVLVPRMSYPWPLEDKTFGTGYIDGDHWNGMPLNDWNSLKRCVKHAIVFDDYIQGKPEVLQAVGVAAQDPEWLLIQISGTQAVLRRRE
jgi:hypothetical protein